MSAKTLPVVAPSTNPKCSQLFSHPNSADTTTSNKSGGGLFGPKPTEIRLLIVGIDGAGKTVLFNRVTGVEATFTSNTIGFNVDTVNFPTPKSKDTLSLWDVGGLAAIRQKWKDYYSGVDGIVFVVDAAGAKEKIAESEAELSKLLAVPELAHAPLLVFANKQDEASSLSVKEIAEALKLPPSGEVDEKGRRYLVQGGIAKTGEGVREGLEWIYRHLKEKGAGVKKGNSATKSLAMAVIAVAAVAVAFGVLMRK